MELPPVLPRIRILIETKQPLACAVSLFRSAGFSSVTIYYKIKYIKFDTNIKSDFVFTLDSSKIGMKDLSHREVQIIIWKNSKYVIQGYVLQSGLSEEMVICFQTILTAVM
jgi:hypothetical protein